MPTHAQRYWRHWLLLILIVAALARVGLIVGTPHFVPWGDPVDYQRHAESISAGYGFPSSQIATPGTPSAFRPPAYPFLLGGVYALFGIHLIAGRLLGVVLGVVAVALLALVGRCLWGPGVGLTAAALAAVFLPLISLNGTLLSESLFVPVELAFALCVAACARRPDRPEWALAAGVVCAVAALTREVADAWLLLVLGVIVLSGVGRRVKLRSAVVAVLAFVVVLAPWTIRNASVFHAFVPISTEGGFTLAGQYNSQSGRDDSLQAVWRQPLELVNLRPTLLRLYFRRGGVNEVQLSSALQHAGLSYLRHHPGHLAVAVLFDSLRMLDVGKAHGFTTAISYRELNLPGSLHGLTTWSARIVALLALAAVVLRLVGRRVRLAPWWLWGIPILIFVTTVPTVGNPLKRVPLDPFLLLLAAVALGAAAQAVERRARRGTVGPWTEPAGEPGAG